MNKGHPTELLWSLLSTEVIYTSHTANTSLYLPFYSERLYDCLDLSEINYPRVLNWDCSNRFEEVQSILKIFTHFEETSDVSTMYMGKLCHTGRNYKYENKIFVSGNCTSWGTLMDKTHMRVLFDMGASKSCVSKSFYMANISLHTLPKCYTASKDIIIRNGQLVPVMFIIPATCSIQDHVFEIFTMVADIHEAICLVFKVRNMTEIEGEIRTKRGSFKFLNRSIPIYPKDRLEVPSMGKIYLKLISPFSEELNGKAIANLWDDNKNHTLKLWLIKNQRLVEFVNNASEHVRFSNKV